ncbi:RDD family protein [Psychroflexus aestuariivivens]|uniref:RDD family protein n=1 Tax=Psychroflexus aestuariivivens TaxID=1795040 RepID=UPI000FDCADC6|nr:RDD family protein [Psychroflexus aestuariivivens]
MSNFQIETAQNVKIQQNVATVWDRILAYIIDLLIIFAYAIVTSLIASSLIGNPFENYASILVIGLPPFLYHLLFETFMNGQSPGKTALKIRVTNLDGTPPVFSGYLLRWLLRFIDINLASGGIAIAVILLNGKGQRLGDLAAKTTVISEKRKTSLWQTPNLELSENYSPQYPQVTVFEDKDIRKIKSIYDGAKRRGEHNIIVKLSQKVASTMNVEPKEKPIIFIEIILKDYTFYTQN